MKNYTVILSYLDNSSAYSFERVQATTPEKAIERAQIQKYTGLRDYNEQDRVLALKEMRDPLNQYLVYGCIEGHHTDVNPYAE